MEKKLRKEIKKLINGITWRIRLIKLKAKVGAIGTMLLGILLMLYAATPLFLWLFFVWMVVHFSNWW